MTLPRLHLVTDDDVLRSDAFLGTVEAVLRCCGADAALHLRGHDVSGARLYELAVHMAAVALRTGAWLFVNDRIDVARAARANGVQLGARSLSVQDARVLLGAGARIGVSTHSALESVQAATDGADFVLLGTIYESATHAGRAGAGPAVVEDTVTRAALPVIAIGGVTPGRVPEIAAAGGWGVAVLGGIWHAADAERAAADYVARVRSAWSGGDA